MLLDSFLSNDKKLTSDIEHINEKLASIDDKINKIKESILDLAKNKSLEEQALKVKLKVENLLEEKLNGELLDIEKVVKQKRDSIKQLQKELREKFNLEYEIKKAQEYINKEMVKIGNNLNFEKSYYKPINLKFSLESFDLWHDKFGEKIFLRSMGSGANWLSCHIALFTSIHKYFCSLQGNALVPPILFLDQPSQVYFPTLIDNEKEFNSNVLPDEDLLAVTNLFDQLVDFCESTKSETGITPQIIITDHADHLKLKGSVDFESLVKGRRWRERGFIDISQL